jgi:prepilin-type N-terminal cleavage/methylation domain-containing protein
MNMQAKGFRVRKAGFTLLEIMLAVAIMGLIGMAIYQFTDATLASSQFFVQTSNEESAYAGLRHLLETQLAELPFGEQGTLIGLRIKGKDGQRDALTLVCPPGNGVLTPSTKGLYEVTIDIREIPRGSGKFALGMERAPHDDDDDDDDVVPPAQGGLKSKRASLPSDWIKLMDGVRTLELAYFDSRLNGWVDKWNDQTILPNLVRMRLGTAAGRAPYELVVRVPSGGLRREGIIPQVSTPGVQVGGMTGTAQRPGNPAQPKPLPLRPPPAGSPFR